MTIYADEKAYEVLQGNYPEPLLQHATEESFGTEFMDYKMAIRSVDSINEAILHIQKYGSGHSESIVTTNNGNAVRFQNEVDAACIYVNAPTSFTDGAQFGLGAEIGISTQKLGHAVRWDLKRLPPTSGSSTETARRAHNTQHPSPNIQTSNSNENILQR